MRYDMMLYETDHPRHSFDLGKGIMNI